MTHEATNDKHCYSFLQDCLAGLNMLSDQVVNESSKHSDYERSRRFQTRQVISWTKIHSLELECVHSSTLILQITCDLFFKIYVFSHT
jgi:hypothetical protein